MICFLIDSNLPCIDKNIVCLQNLDNNVKILFLNNLFICINRKIFKFALYCSTVLSPKKTLFEKSI